MKPDSSASTLGVRTPTGFARRGGINERLFRLPPDLGGTVVGAVPCHGATDRRHGIIHPVRLGVAEDAEPDLVKRHRGGPVFPHARLGGTPLVRGSGLRRSRYTSPDHERHYGTTRSLRPRAQKRGGAERPLSCTPRRPTPTPSGSTSKWDLLSAATPPFRPYASRAAKKPREQAPH